MNLNDKYKIENNSQQIINVKESTKNLVGTAGFIVALIGLFTRGIPLIGWYFFLFGVFISTIGIFRKPRSLAIAGLVISFFGMLILDFFVERIIFLIVTLCSGL